MKLAIQSYTSSAYSETFIHMQMERLPCALRIHGGPVAEETIPGGPLKPLRSFRGLMDTAWHVGVRKTKWEGPQSAELVRRLRKHRIDRVLANFGHYGVALLPACRKLSIPLVVHFHGYDAHRKDIIDQFQEKYRTLGREAAAIIAVSHGMVDALREIGIPDEKIHLTRYGANSDRFEAKTCFPEKTVFFGVGRFTEKKAPYLTLLAFSKALGHLPGAKLILAGNGELLEATRNLAIALNLEKSVEFPGILSPEAVAEHMQEASAFVQHSLEPLHGPATGDREGTPVAVLEAMMSGLPVISTRHAGIGEVVEHGKTGLLVAERDVDGMAEAMVKVGTSRDYASTLGQAAHTEALSKYTAGHYIDSLRQILESV